MATPLCGCGRYSIGACQRCGIPLCGLHGVGHARLVCSDCVLLEKEWARRSAEERRASARNDGRASTDPIPTSDRGPLWPQIVSDANRRSRPDVVGLQWEEEGTWRGRYVVSDQFDLRTIIGTVGKKVGPPIHRAGGSLNFFRERVPVSVYGDIPTCTLDRFDDHGELIQLDIIALADLMVRLNTRQSDVSHLCWHSPRSDPPQTDRPRIIPLALQSRSIVDAVVAECLDHGFKDWVGLTWDCGNEKMQVARELLMLHGPVHQRTLQKRRVVKTYDQVGRVVNCRLEPESSLHKLLTTIASSGDSKSSSFRWELRT